MTTRWYRIPGTGEETQDVDKYLAAWQDILHPLNEVLAPKGLLAQGYGYNDTITIRREYQDKNGTMWAVSTNTILDFNMAQLIVELYLNQQNKSEETK